MALDVYSVELATSGRLNSDDAETQRQLDAAMAAARNYCGWHVTPELADVEVTLDGSGGPLLVLPTLKLTALTSVTEKAFYAEDVIDVDVQYLDWSTRGLVAKRSRQLWTDRFQGVTVTMSHGFDEAPDFEAAILSAIDRGAFSTVDTVKMLGPFQYDTATVTSGVFNGTERALLDRYSLERQP
jgi:hypothetical protein